MRKLKATVDIEYHEIAEDDSSRNKAADTVAVRVGEELRRVFGTGVLSGGFFEGEVTRSVVRVDVDGSEDGFYFDSSGQAGAEAGSDCSQKDVDSKDRVFLVHMNVNGEERQISVRAHGWHNSRNTTFYRLVSINGQQHSRTMLVIQDPSTVLMIRDITDKDDNSG